MNWQSWKEGRYAYKADHVMRACLLISVILNVGLAVLVWAIIGLLEVWR